MMLTTRQSTRTSGLVGTGEGVGGVPLLLGVLPPPFTDPVDVLLEGLGEVGGEMLVSLVL